MKLNHLLGLLGGLLFFMIALAWWSFMPHSPDRTSGEPSPRRALTLQLNSVADNRPRPLEPQEFANDTPPNPTAEDPGEETLKRRCLQLAERDPREAVTLAINTHDSTPHPGLLENLVGQWATHDLQASYQWVLQQQPGASRDLLLERVAFAGSQSNPAAAARIVIDEMTPGQTQTEAAICVLHQWALRDLNAAAAWADAFPEGPLRQRAINEIEGLRKESQTAGP